MTIRRAPRKESNFTILSNEVINDSRISWDAGMVLIYLLSKPDHWEVSVQQLVKERREAKKSLGRDAIYRILNELIEIGYVSRVNVKDVNGRFCGYSYEVQEVPITSKPSTDNPSTVNTTLERTVSEKELSQERDGSSSEPLSGSGKGWEDQFEDFWAVARSVWFGRAGNKQNAKTQFLNRVKGTKSRKPTHTCQQLIDLAKQDAKRRRDLQERDGFCPYMRHAERWLRDACWEDELDSQDAEAESDPLEGIVWN